MGILDILRTPRPWAPGEKHAYNLAQQAERRIERAARAVSHKAAIAARRDPVATDAIAANPATNRSADRFFRRG